MMDKQKVQLDNDDLGKVTGGVNGKTRYVSAFYCEYCDKTIKLNMVASLERAKKEHNTKFHPEIITRR